MTSEEAAMAFATITRVPVHPGMRHVEFEVGDLGVAAALVPSGS